MKTQKEIFYERLEKKRGEGLLHIGFCPNPNADFSETSEEELYAELNRMDDAETLEDEEIF